MNDIIIDRNNDTVKVITPNCNHVYIFRNISKNNNELVATYVLNVNDINMTNIKVTLPQCNTVVTEIPKT